jgi:DNA repair exonuclease SbcCD ATPase subunit
MNTVKFLELSLRNFFSFKDTVIVELPTSGLFLVKGENKDLQAEVGISEIKNTNGSGKSALLRSLLWVLFGESGKKLKADSVINKKTKKDTEVSITFSIGNNTWKIIRYRKTANGSGLTLLFKDGDNWKDSSFSDVKLTQEKINEILGFNYEIALYTLLISKEYNINLIEMPNNVRSPFLESLMRIDALKPYAKFVKEKLTLQRKEFGDLTLEASSLSGQLFSLKETIRNTIYKLKKNRTDTINKINQLEKELKILSEGVSTKDLISFIEFQKNIFLIENRKNELNQINNTFNKNLKNYSSQKKVLFQNLKTHNEYLVPKKSQCNNCDKEISSCASQELLDSSLKVISSNKSNIKAIRDLSLVNIKKIKEIKNELQTLNAKKGLLNLAHDFKLIPDAIKEPIIGAIVRGTDPMKEIHSIVSLQEQIEQLRKIKVDTTIIWESKNKVFEINKLKKENSNKSINLKKQIDIGSFWEDTLDFKNEGSLKNYVVSKVIPVFNNVLRSVLEIIFEGNMEIIFDNFWNENISYYGENYDYGQLSLGEKAKVNLAISLALFSLFRINLGGTSLLFIDEGFSHIDEATIEKYLNLLRSTYSIDTAIFIVSHEYGLHSFIPDGTYIVSKKNGESSLRIG